MTGSRERIREHVPLARRELFADRRRGALTVAGVAAALLLTLVLDAIFAGAVQRVTSYIRSSPADVFLSQSGVRTMHMSASAVPPDTAARARRVPGAAWAAPIAFSAGALLAGPRGQELAYLIGYDVSTGRGGPGRLVAGRAPRSGEAVVDRLAADQLGLSLGGHATVFGRHVRISGLTAGTTSITNTIVFVPRVEFAALRGATTSYVLVRAALGVSADQLAARLRRAFPDVTVQTRGDFVASEARVVTDMSADLIRMMALIGLLLALAVIALGSLVTTLARTREYAVLKALGAPTRRLAAVVVGQIGYIVVLALAVSTVLALAIAAVMPSVAPTVDLLVTVESVARAGAAALVVGALAAALPLLRVARVDPVTAFREAR